MVSQAVVPDVNDRLLDSAQALVLRGGPRAATVSAAAAGAGLSRMTVYRKFGDRHRMLAALFNRELGRILEDAVAQTGQDTAGQLADLVVVTVHGINEHPLMQAVLAHEPEQLTEWTTGRLGHTQRSARDLLAAAIRRGQAAGTVRAADPDAMALTLVIVAQAFVFGHRLGGSDRELHTLVKGYLS